jgi:phytoene dehydrogenase-like protein
MTISDNSVKDLIIIGAGMNGLSAGLAYALNNRGKKVLIVEKNPVSGGYVTSFTRKGYQFDTCQMISNVSDILDYFGVKIDFHDYGQDFIRVFRVGPAAAGIKTIELARGDTEFEAQFLSLFPAEAAKLKKLFDYSLAMFREIYGLKYALGFWDILKLLVTCPKVVRNKDKTLTAYLKMFGIGNPEIALLFQVFSGMCGLPNDKIAALLTVGVMYSLREKAYRPRMPFIELPQKMEQRFREFDGEIVFKKEVEKIIIGRGTVQGIRLKDGSVFHSPNVISTIDVKTTMEDLVGMDLLRSIKPSYAKKISSLRMTTSAFTVNLGLDNADILKAANLQCGYALLTSGNDAFQKLYAAFENSESVLSEKCFYIGLACPPAADWLPTLSLQVIPQPVGDWVNLRNNDRKRYIQEKEKTADMLVGIVEKYLVPGLKKHIVVRDVATPATYSRYSGSPTGSIYDMASVPENFGANRLPVLTPVRGLLVPKFAHGVFGTMNSGLQAVDILLHGKVMHGNSRFKKAAE